MKSSMVCAPPSNSGPSATDKAKEIARLKLWESEQAAEVEKCVKFIETTCGCTLADGKPCSTLIPCTAVLCGVQVSRFLLKPRCSWTWSFWEM